MGNSLTYEKIKHFIEIESKSNCKLLSTHYKGSKEKLIIECCCGESFKTLFYDFKRSDKRQKRKCSYCTGTKVRNKICLICGKTFKPIKKKQIYCGIACRTKAMENKVIVKCSFCGEEMSRIKHDINRSKNLYCSQECKSNHQKELLLGENNPNFKNATIIKECSNCSKEILVLKCNLKNSDGTIKENFYCSQKCKAEHQKEILKGKNNPKFSSIEVECVYCGKSLLRTPVYINDRNNVFCSKECKANWQSQFIRGKNHPLYDTTISEEEREIGRNFDGYKYWRREVFKRDNYTCQICQCGKGGNLHAHHLDAYHWCKEKRTDINNGVTLCNSCHNKFHSTYGLKNNTKEQYEEFTKTMCKIDSI